MIVVADSSPLNYLAQIRATDLLGQLYGRVLAPESVMAELRDQRAPAAVLSWASQPHTWFEVCRLAGSPPETLRSLGAGERDAIQLALERHADFLLIDEKRGRTEARRLGLETTGTLGILLEAGRRGLVDAEKAILQLSSETNFRIEPRLRDELIRRARTFLSEKP